MARYFVPLTLLGENGVPLRSDDVKLINTENGLEITLNYFKAGQYYADTPFRSGNYDIYVGGYFYGNFDIPTLGEVPDGSITDEKLVHGGFITGTEPDPNGHYNVPRPGCMYYYWNGPNQYVWIGVSTQFNTWIKLSQSDADSPLTPI